jgi:hypothetical protein
MTPPVQTLSTGHHFHEFTGRYAVSHLIMNQAHMLILLTTSECLLRGESPCKMTQNLLSKKLSLHYPKLN